MTTDDRGRTALAVVLEFTGYEHHFAARELAAAILGERGVFLPEGYSASLAYDTGFQDGLGFHAEEIARLREALTEIRDCARSLTGYCQWCDARPEQTHQPDCPADIARAALEGSEP